MPKKTKKLVNYQQKKRWKLLLFLAAVAIAVFSMLYTDYLVKRLAVEEQKKMQNWADANRLLTSEQDMPSDVNSFLLSLITNNKTIPVILTDEKGNINSAVNLDSLQINDTIYLKEQLTLMKGENEPITFRYDPTDTTKTNTLYYRESVLLRQLRYYPYIQLSLISLFLLVSYFAFSASRKSEQNKVWLGMSKETAHQLGTPISSMVAWMEFIKSNDYKLDPPLVEEMSKDLKRLELITERFSKIGSEPVLKKEFVPDVIRHSFDYMKKRSSEKVQFNLHIANENDCIANMNMPLFEWVIENITKNAIDAMNGEGIITCNINANTSHVYIDISDTGKGINKNQFKTIFKPGFTTKKRGWGMGLSLVKRIIEDYHRGEIFVKHSEAEKGTTFRIILKK